IQVLPVVTVTVSEFTEEEHNQRHGIDIGSLGKSSNKNSDSASASLSESLTPSDQIVSVSKSKKVVSISNSNGADGNSGVKDKLYYCIRCKDNGCGIASDQIGNMLGRVLSGSKQGLK